MRLLQPPQRTMSPVSKRSVSADTVTVETGTGGCGASIGPTMGCSGSFSVPGAGSGSTAALSSGAALSSDLDAAALGSGAAAGGAIGAGNGNASFAATPSGIAAQALVAPMEWQHNERAQLYGIHTWIPTVLGKLLSKRWLLGSTQVGHHRTRVK